MQEDYEKNKAAIQAEADRRVKEAESKNKGFWETVGGGFEDVGKVIGGSTAVVLSLGISSDARDFAEKSWKNLF